MDPTEFGGLMIRPIDVMHQIPDLINNQSSADLQGSPPLVRAKFQNSSRHSSGVWNFFWILIAIREKLH